MSLYQFSTLIKHELRYYFVTPIAYVVIAVFWSASGFFFSFNQLFVSAINMVSAFHNMSLLLMLMIPFLSMRTFAEERQNNTLELLMTLPISEAGLVWAKYLALMTIVLLMLLGSAVAVAILSYFGDPDYGPIVGGYIGIFLLAASFSGVGVLMSSISTNQIVAAALTWFCLLLLWFADYGASLFPSSWLVYFFQHISFSVHYLDLIRGVLTRGTLIYFISVIFLTLVASVQILRIKRS